MKKFEENKKNAYAKMHMREKWGQDFENLLKEANDMPAANNYLNMMLTKEQAIGYVLAALKLSSLSADEQGKLIAEIENQLLTMQPEEAERIYAESWYR